MFLRCLLRTCLAASIAWFGFVSGAAAQPYPSKPIRLIVPFPAGGATDAAARELAEGLAPLLGQSVVVENRPGADGVIAAQAVLSAKADGHTLLFASSSLQGVPYAQKDSPFKSLDAFTPVSLVCRLAFAVVVNPGLPAHDMRELVAHARAHPGAVNFGSGSTSEALAGAEFMRATGTDLVQVNYKGGAQIVPDLASGQVQVSFGPITPMLPFIQDGRLSVLAVALDHRIAAVPAVPTLREAGISDVSGAGALQGVMGPPGMPATVVATVNAAIAKVMSRREIREKLAARGQEAETSSPSEFAAMLRSERAAWERFAGDPRFTPQ